MLVCLFKNVLERGLVVGFLGGRLGYGAAVLSGSCRRDAVDRSACLAVAASARDGGARNKGLAEGLRAAGGEPGGEGYDGRVQRGVDGDGGEELAPVGVSPCSHRRHGRGLACLAQGDQQQGEGEGADQAGGLCLAHGGGVQRGLQGQPVHSTCVSYGSWG